VPIMYRFDLTARDAWARFPAHSKERLLAAALYGVATCPQSRGWRLLLMLIIVTAASPDASWPFPLWAALRCCRCTVFSAPTV